MKKDKSSSRLRFTQTNIAAELNSKLTLRDSDSSDSSDSSLCRKSVKAKTNDPSSKLAPLKIRVTCVCIVLLALLSTGFLKRVFSISTNLADENFLEIGKCPACYGQSLCQSFLKGEIVPNSLTEFIATQLLNSKNVFYAKFNDKQVSSYLKKIILFQ